MLGSHIFQTPTTFVCVIEQTGTVTSTAARVNRPAREKVHEAHTKQEDANTHTERKIFHMYSHYNILYLMLIKTKESTEYSAVFCYLFNLTATYRPVLCFFVVWG